MDRSTPTPSLSKLFAEADEALAPDRLPQIWLDALTKEALSVLSKTGRPDYPRLAAIVLRLESHGAWGEAYSVAKIHFLVRLYAQSLLDEKKRREEAPQGATV